MTTETAHLNGSEKAVRLVYKALRPKASAAQDREYAELLLHWDASPEWRETVRAYARLLELEVIGTTRQKLILRPSSEASAFTARLSDFRRNMPEVDRGILALVLIAIGAAFFRSGNDLSGLRDTIQELTIGQIEGILDELCEQLKVETDGDPERRSDVLQEAWRRLIAKPRRMERSVTANAEQHHERQERANTSSRYGMVKLVVSRLVDHDLLRPNVAGEMESYYPTERFRLQLRSAMADDTLYDRLVRALEADQIVA
ncbi:MAG: hypothetical protein GKS00_24860 [Alphaproteobacteria bacterium]|nr:hypothetical protein [Alphaproteobacteria bacterium]